VTGGKVVLLGALAGATIFLGLPFARLKEPKPRLRASLNAVAIGILVFLLWDVLAHAAEPVESALTAAHGGTGSWARFLGLAVVFAVGIGVGLLALVAYEGRMAEPPRAVGAGVATSSRTRVVTWGSAERLAVMIAVGIGLHNFSEGLAIGQSAAKGEVSLATMLIVGFALHNGTEGFGIIAPLTGGRRPEWPFLVTLGIIGGGPTFLGTVIGRAFVNDTLYLAFLALAAGSILYVVIQLIGVAMKLGQRNALMVGVLGGLLLGFATDWVLVAAGA
jgi:ZIP family zinc transporter